MSGPARRGRPAKSVDAVTPPPIENFTFPQVLEMMKVMATEMRKPTELEQRKLDKEDAFIKKQQLERIELTRVEIQRKEATKRGCAHASVNRATGQVRHAWRAQVCTPSHTKPYFIPTCSQCFSQLPPVAATTDMLTGGVNLSDYEGMNMAVLEQWAKTYPATI